MHSKYKRKSARQNWNEESMKAAIKAVQNSEMGWHRAAKVFGVPQATLRRRAQGKNKISKGHIKGYLGGRKKIFDEDLKRQIVAHIKSFESRFFGLTTKDVRKLAHQLAEKNSLPHNFSRIKEKAGWEWLSCFRSRNPDISLRLPESTSLARAMGFNKPQVTNYFNKLSSALDKLNFNPTKIWNMDESGLSTVPSRNSKIFAAKGKKQVGILTSAERGQHVTVICCMSAAGVYVPPAFIFARKNMKKELMDEAPNGAVAYTQENGWTSSEIFLRWLHHFVAFTEPSTEDKVVLLLDGHASHKHLEAKQFAKENGIILFRLPPHTTHRLQPLDVAFFGPLTEYYNQELNLWLKNHPGRAVSQFQIGGIFRKAYAKAATVKNAEAGFRSTGIYPFSPDVFPEHLFAPSEVTDNKTMPSTSTENPTNIVPPCQAPVDNEPSTSKPASRADLSTEDLPSTSWAISCSDILPLPKATVVPQKRRKTGNFGETNITPELEKLKTIAAQKLEKDRKRSLRKKNDVKKKIVDDENFNEEPFSADEENPDIPLHTSTLTFLLLAWDRFRLIRNPTKPRLPAFVCAIGAWLTSVCLVLPYPIYIIYIDLGKFSNLSTFNGVGMCTVNLADDMKEYMRGIFLVMYASPIATISYLFVRISRELAHQSPAAVITFEARCKEGRSRTDSHSTTTEFRSSRGDCDRVSQYSRGSYRDYENGRTRYEIHEPDINVLKEKRTQKYLVSMITMYAICLCPLMILRLARLALVETYENSGQFDITYTIFVWVAFLPTCSTPLLFAAWQMSRSSKERLRGYFRFSSNKLRQSCETVVTAAGTPAAPRAKRNYHDTTAQPLDEGYSDSNSQQDLSSS